MLVTDDTAPPANSGIKLRIVDAALSNTPMDVYVLPPGTTASGSPTIGNLFFNAASSYQILAAGSYDVFFTTTGTTQVLFHTGAITFAASQNRTIVVLNDCAPTNCDLSGHTLWSVTLADLN